MMSYFYLRRISLCLVFVFILGVSFILCDENEPFTIGDIKVAPGEMRSGYLTVPEGDDPGCFIPITIFNGKKKGKTLALVAGVHGYEYPPILSLYRIKHKIDPDDLSGTLVLVHIANLPGFQRRMVYYNPHDWKNLNRVFPGDPEGTSAQRIAYVLTEEVVKKCDCLIDLHCGDANEALIPYCYWMLSGDQNLDNITKEMVLAFGIKYIIIDKSRTKDKSNSKYLGNTAVLHAKPAITTESGYLGKTDEESIARIVRGILSVMRYFEMIEGEPQPVSDPVWIDKYEVIYADMDGLFYPKTQMGYYVSKGEIVGTITDYLGNVKQEIKSPFTGIILYIIETPPANKGEPLFEVGRIQKD